MTAQPPLQRAEHACTDLVQAGQQVTFTAVAARAGLARATLYRHPQIRAVINEHRIRQADAQTLSGLATEISHMRTALEVIAGNVRQHKERLRRLEQRATRKPEPNPAKRLQLDSVPVLRVDNFRHVFPCASRCAGTGG
jgi:AcrR family transcriptional regulator